MVDDLLDFTADEKVLGKPVANDLREGKLTLPVIFLLRRGGRRAADLVSGRARRPRLRRVSREEMLRLAREHGALDEARALAERYADQARQDLSVFERSPYPRGARAPARLHPGPRSLRASAVRTPSPMTTLATSRLRLRPFSPADAPALHAPWNDPDVGRWLWDGGPRCSRDRATRSSRPASATFRERGFGMFTLRAAEDPEAVIGFAGLRTIGETSDIEVLYAPLPSCWGRGLATEAARAVLDWGFDTLGLDAIAAGADPPNRASFEVMARLGMRLLEATSRSSGRPARYASPAGDRPHAVP